jgi:lysophospholipase L1-like esterase
MSPYLIESDPSNLMRKHMDAYSRVVEKLAHEFDALFVDTQAAFDRYLAHRPPQSLSDDRIHPNKTGHMIIANAFLESIK